MNENDKKEDSISPHLNFLATEIYVFNNPNTDLYFLTQLSCMYR